MATKICLLRGVNVSGKNKLKMAELREKLENEGLANVNTYIQSGNIVFTSSKSERALTQLIHDTIKREFGYDVPVLVRNVTYIQQCVSSNPFQKFDPAKMCVTMFDKAPSAAVKAKIDATLYEPDAFKFGKKEVFIHCPNGFGRTKLTNNFFESILKVNATSRNWNTMNKLIEIADSL